VTLRRLLVAGVTLAFLAVLAGVEAIVVRNAQLSLQQQLEAHAQETATSLALTLGALLKEADPALSETVINPVFDRGYFASVRLLAVDGRELVARRITPGAADAPAWFRALFPLEAPAGEALVSSGWRQLGRVAVTVHPEIAYRQLWRTAYEMLAWFALLYLAAVLAVGRYLSSILRPLDALERAAIAIGNRDFRAVTIDAQTVELRRVAGAMTALAEKVREAIAQESARAERLLRDAYVDPVAGIASYRGFAQRVRTALQSETGVAAGALAIIALKGLEEVNRRAGMAAGDALVRDAGQALARALEPVPGAVAGRRQGATFLAFMPDLRRDQASAQIQSALAALRERLSAPSPTAVDVTAGVALFEGTRPQLAQLEDWAEVALHRATQQGSALLVLDADAGRAGGRTSEAWGAVIEAALAEHRLALYGQNAFALPGGEVLHVEAVLRLIEADGSVVPAGAFVPAAHRLSLLPRLDREVAEVAVALLSRGGAAPARLALNVSMQSVADPSYRAVLHALLAREPGIARRLVFEVSAHGLDADATAAFAGELRAAGAQFALDDVELSAESLALTHRLLPEYVKLSPAYGADIAAHADARFLLESLVAILRPLEVKVIVKGVEDPALPATLALTGVAGYQGHAGERPHPLA